MVMFTSRGPVFLISVLSSDEMDLSGDIITALRAGAPSEKQIGQLHLTNLVVRFALCPIKGTEFGSRWSQRHFV
jgi:hypothetical protein